MKKIIIFTLKTIALMLFHSHWFVFADMKPLLFFTGSMYQLATDVPTVFRNSKYLANDNGNPGGWGLFRILCWRLGDHQKVRCVVCVRFLLVQLGRLLADTLIIGLLYVLHNPSFCFVRLFVCFCVLCVFFCCFFVFFFYCVTVNCTFVPCPMSHCPTTFIIYV